jgi:hypothetical protein
MMRSFLFGMVIVLCTLWGDVAFAQSPLSVSDFRAVSSVIERDFKSIDKLYTIGMTDDPGGRFDVVVIGSDPRNDGWRVEVISVQRHKVATIWNSTIAARDPQYSNSGPKNVTLELADYDYTLLIETCAQHLCHDGVSGFLAFFGKAEQSAAATVVTKGLNGQSSGLPRYDVSFSHGIGLSSRLALQRAICDSSTLSNKLGFPFSCTNP